MPSVYQPRNCRRRELSLRGPERAAASDAFGTATFGTRCGNCIADVSDKEMHAHSLPSSMHRRRGNANDVPVYFSVGSGDTSVIVTTVGAPSRFISCLASLSSFSPPPSVLFLSAPFLSRPIIIPSNCNVGECAKRANRPAACSRDRWHSVTLLRSDLDPPPVRRTLPFFVIYRAGTLQHHGESTRGPYSRYAFNAKWDYLILVAH